MYFVNGYPRCLVGDKIITGEDHESTKTKISKGSVVEIIEAVIGDNYYTIREEKTGATITGCILGKETKSAEEEG